MNLNEDPSRHWRSRTKAAYAKLKYSRSGGRVANGISAPGETSVSRSGSQAGSGAGGIARCEIDGNTMSRALANVRDTRDRTRARGLTKWQQKFLRVLRETPSVKAACSSAGVSRQTAYRNRANDTAFAELWQDALDASVDQLEAVAFKLAAEGDANLIQFLLRCHRPQVYRDVTRHEVGVAGKIIFLPSKAAGDE